MEKECKSCRKRSCPEKKSIKLQNKLARWFKEEKLSAAEGLLLLDHYIEENASKLLRNGRKERKDRHLLSALAVRRIIRDDISDETDDYDGDSNSSPKEGTKQKKKMDLWYIG